MRRSGGAVDGDPLAEGLRAVRKRKVFEDVVIQLRALVEQGRLEVGDRLPAERDLARRLGVSRHSVREALRAMEQRGLMVSRPGSGTFVADGGGAAAAETLARALGRERGRLAEVFQLRRLLEPQVAWLAARRVTPAEVVDCERLIERQRAEGQSSPRAMSLDRDFHLLVARATHNEVLIRTVEQVVDILAESRAAIYESAERFRRSVDGHSVVVEALRRGDPEAAWHAMDQHLAAIERIALGAASPPIAPPGLVERGAMA